MKINWSKTDSMSQSDLGILILLVVSFIFYVFSDFIKVLLSLITSTLGVIGEKLVGLIGFLFTWKVLVVILLYLIFKELVSIRHLLSFSMKDKDS